MIGQWRLIPYQEHDGATNMAIDEAILEAHLAKLVPPTLRLYGFKPACISIGHSQKLPAEMSTKAKSLGFDLVRRPTGGRAVLHLNELTYSFVGSSDGDGQTGFLHTSILESYKQICAGLQLAFRKLGLDLELGDTQASYRDIHDCFAATTGSDLHWHGKKIAGSAQLRRKNAVLQHGSILLSQDQKLMPELIGSIGSNNQDLRHANLFEAVGRKVEIEELQKCFKEGFSEAFSVEFVESDLIDREKASVKQLTAAYHQT